MSQADDVFMRQFGGVLGLLVLFAVIFYLIAKAVGNVSHEQIVASPSATLERIAPVGRVVLAESESAAAPTVAVPPAAPAETSTVQVNPATPGVVPTEQESAAATAPAAATPPAAASTTAPAESAPAAPPQQPTAPAAPAQQAAAAETAPAPADEATAAAEPAYNGQELYQSVCFACHVTGAAGAPKLTDTAAWSERATRGVEALTATVISGKGAMPPRGGRPDVADGALEAAVRYMLDEAGVPAN